MEEIVGDVDCFLWFYVNECFIFVDVFISFVKVFLLFVWDCYDIIYGVIEKLIFIVLNCFVEE